MPGTDLHTHLAPDFGEDALPPAIELGEDGRYSADGKTLGLPALYRREELIAYLDESRLDRAVVSVPPPFYRQGLGAGAAAAWARELNDGILRRIDGEPRLSALAYLPLEHPDLALSEVRRVAGAGFVGFTAAAGGRSPSLADASLEPLWEELDERAALLLLHPGESPDPRLEDLYLANLLGNPQETTLAAAQLVFGDVLPRFPALRFLLVHGGGAAAALAGRWERGALTKRPGLRPLTESPLEAVRRLYADTVTHHPQATALATAVFGEDRIVLGSDWPFPMGAYDHSGLGRRVRVENPGAALGGIPSARPSLRARGAGPPRSR